MLIEAPYKVGDVVSLKLSSGEEILGRLEAEKDNNVTLKKPMVLIAQEKGLGLAPFMFSVSPDGKFVMKSTAISCMAKTEAEIAKQYVATTSGIVTA
jgi:hypothetical protein|tara:strand:- start:4665 stop:4955 length:291 start_codon:yes stop_codon:yes gene_type:complete